MNFVWNAPICRFKLPLFIGLILTYANRLGIDINSSLSISHLWPPRPASMLLAKLQSIGSDHSDFDYDDLATLEASDGAAFCIPGTRTTFYGSAFGHFIFDWTCHVFDGDNTIEAAHLLWRSLYTFEEWRHISVQKRLWSPSTVSGVTDSDAESCAERARRHSHFLVSYRCLLFELSQITGCARPIDNLGDFMRTHGPVFLHNLLANISDQRMSAAQLIRTCTALAAQLSISIQKVDLHPLQSGYRK
jgi:hypothetical protein